MATQPVSVTETAEQNPARKASMQGLLAIVLATACGIILAAQAFLIRRINVNWDEFWFLNHVHALLRGELTGTFQYTYTHLFTWLAHVGDEMTQILVARGVMFALFALSVVLLFRFASRWVTTPAAIVAVLCFLAASPVLRHGASFRTDSLLLPLLMGALVLITRPRPSARSDIAAGVLFGVAMAVTVKAALFLPLLAVLAFTRGEPVAGGALTVLKRWAIPAVAAAGVFAAILLLHTWSLPAGAGGDAPTFAATVVRKTLLEVPFFPRWDYFRVSLGPNLATWLLIIIGTVAAVVRRRWDVAACALAVLLPLAVYRNAFPYFYVVMLAPAAVLAGVAVDEIRAAAGRRADPARLDWIALAVAVPVMLQAFVHVSVLKADRQWPERELIAAVHKIFPQPVPYLDHSGMIASFRKVNFFMSSWGMESYRAQGVPFMPGILRDERPPLLVGNRSEIDPLTLDRVLPEDQALIRQFYLQYWGPIWVAGARAQVPAEGSERVPVPFPGRYRVVTRRPVAIDGTVRANGDVVEISGEAVTVAHPDGTAQGRRAPVILVWAAAQAPPDEPAMFFGVYTGL